MKTKVTPSQIATMRVRFAKGAKKRPVFFPRPTLKELKAKLRGLERTARSLRGDLRRTAVGDEGQQKRIGDALASIQKSKVNITSYAAGIARTDAPKLATIPALQPISKRL
jgi:hypothetical protein